MGGQALSRTFFPSGKSCTGEIFLALFSNGCHVCVEMGSMFRILFKDRFDLNALPAFVSPEKYSFLARHCSGAACPGAALAFPQASASMANLLQPLIDQLTGENACCVRR